MKKLILITLVLSITQITNTFGQIDTSKIYGSWYSCKAKIPVTEIKKGDIRKFSKQAPMCKDSTSLYEWKFNKDKTTGYNWDNFKADYTSTGTTTKFNKWSITSKNEKLFLHIDVSNEYLILAITDTILKLERVNKYQWRKENKALYK